MLAWASYGVLYPCHAAQADLWKGEISSVVGAGQEPRAGGLVLAGRI